MKNPCCFLLPPVVLGLAILTVTTSCRRSDPGDSPGSVAVIAPELKSNGLKDLPGAVYRSQMQSRIHWQPWTTETLARAKAANRMVFAVIALPQQPGFQSTLANMEADPAMVETLNSFYVPVLIDGDASRETGLLTADLCAEINRNLQLPLFVWMSPEANPVAWIPVSGGGNIAELFGQSHSMVARIWADDPEYVLTNSALDNENRRERISHRRNPKIASEQPREDVIRAVRQLCSLYDPLSRSFDEAGGLFPSGAIDLLATAAVHPGVSADLRERAMETTRSLLQDLLTSAMFDPLDGGLFSSRRGLSWAFPVFNRDCVTQARAAAALIRAHHATGDDATLAKALGLISFAEKAFSTAEGLFAVGMARETPAMDWLWRVEDVERALLAEDAAWWIRATGMKGLGNLPSETDPQREYFRGNSIAISQPLDELANLAGENPAGFAVRFESVRKTLLKIRDERLGIMARDENSHAGATFRMVSAYAAAFTATGDDAYRAKAVGLLKKARAAFTEDRYLRMFSRHAPAPVGDGRAFLYALAMQAVLDVSDITLDPAWLDWSDDLATTMTELFADDEFLKECPDRAKIINLPVTDLVMLFDDSTAGLLSMSECRLAARERPLIEKLSTLATPLPLFAIDRPILHTDLIQATLTRHYPVKIIVGENPDPGMLEAVRRLPLRTIQRNPAGPGDDVPAGSCKIVLDRGVSKIAENIETLQEAVLPNSEKQ
jgi:uncharacterized protein